MPTELPKKVDQFRKLYPQVWEAFEQLGTRCHEAGPLDERSRRLVKLALAVGAGLVLAFVRRMRAGISAPLPEATRELKATSDVIEEKLVDHE